MKQTATLSNEPGAVQHQHHRAARHRQIPHRHPAPAMPDRPGAGPAERIRNELTRATDLLLKETRSISVQMGGDRRQGLKPFTNPGVSR